MDEHASAAPIPAFMAVDEGMPNGAESEARGRSAAHRGRGSRLRCSGRRLAMSADERLAKRRKLPRKQAWPRQERVAADHKLGLLSILGRKRPLAGSGEAWKTEVRPSYCARDRRRPGRCLARL